MHLIRTKDLCGTRKGLKTEGEMMKVFNEPSEIASKDSGFNQLNSSDIKRKREKKNMSSP